MQTAHCLLSGSVRFCSDLFLVNYVLSAPCGFVSEYYLTLCLLAFIHTSELSLGHFNYQLLMRCGFLPPDLYN